MHRACGTADNSVIPSMGDFLSIMSAAFDSVSLPFLLLPPPPLPRSHILTSQFFGFLFWAVAYWRMNRKTLWKGPWKSLLTLFNV